MEKDNADWPIFVISLPDRLDRRAAITAQLTAHDLPFEIIDAIDGRSGLTEAQKSAVDHAAVQRHLGRPLSDTEIACAQSHQSVYQRVITLDLGGAVILEDDATLTTAFATLYRARAYQRFDILQFSYRRARVFPSRWLWPHLTKDIRAARVLLNSEVTSTYSVNQRAARYLSHGPKPIGGPADWPRDTFGLRHMVTVPQTADQNGDTLSSDIEFGRVDLASRVNKDRSFRRLLRLQYWKVWLRKRLSRKLAWERI
ncbi:MAG: glycosyltransferase family 25 protein [Paracoccaceae bacterium]|nr:glycosyltransferase family 25 protein [Paracoccaceae bacterium]